MGKLFFFLGLFAMYRASKNTLYDAFNSIKNKINDLVFTPWYSCNFDELSKKLHLLVRDFTDLFTKSLALILAYGST